MLHVIRMLIRDPVKILAASLAKIHSAKEQVYTNHFNLICEQI